MVLSIHQNYNTNILKITRMKKAILIPTIIALVAVGFIALGLIMGESQANRLNEFETEVIDRGTLFNTIDSNGIVVSNQSSLLFWKITGEVGNVFVRPGFDVSKGSILASLDAKSTPSQIISIQAEKITAEMALDILQNSTLQQTQAQKRVEIAEIALEDALHPESIQAQALENIAAAQDDLDIAQRNYDIATLITPQSAIDQAYANMILAEYKILKDEELLVDLHNRYNRVKANSEDLGEELTEDYQSEIKDSIKLVEFSLLQDQRSYNSAVFRYNELLNPPDPVDVAVAESDLALAKAQLNEAVREWERLKDGANIADLAVYQAELFEAQRRWERVKDGPHPDDLIMLETQITAADAAIKQMDIVAPFDGTVTAVKTQVNDIVDPGTLAFQIDDLSHIYVNFTITEIDISRIRIGQDTILKFDAIPGKEYQGEVTEIALVGTKILGATSFRVTAEIIDPDKDIRLGMTSSVQIIIDKTKDVLLIPSQAISGLNGDLVVYRFEAEPAGSLIPTFRWEPGSDDNGGFRFPLQLQQPVQIQIQPITITLGTTSKAYSEVLAGDLKVGDTITLNQPSE
jgi:HlyD family secretion protein